MADINRTSETVAEYKARILGYQSGADELSLLAAAPDTLASLIRGLSAEDLARRPASGKWCIKEIVAHLADDELVGAYRIRLILSAPGTAIQAFDQDVWARTGRYADSDVSESLALFRALRQANLRLLRMLRADEWEMYGVHGERGMESLRDIAKYYAGHDINHFRQIEAILRQHEAPQFLLIARERLRPGTEDAYNKNEIQLATACATLKCPHPYLALAPVADPGEVWWLNAFASAEERDGLDDAYARNEPLMAALVPLGKRKEDFRETFTTLAATHRPDLEGHEGLQIAGARFLVISTTKEAKPGRCAIFESVDGQSFRIAAAASRAAADDVAGRLGPDATILAVQPQWSYPAERWVRSDPDFWAVSPVVQIRRR